LLLKDPLLAIHSENTTQDCPKKFIAKKNKKSISEIPSEKYWCFIDLSDGCPCFIVEQ